VEKKIRSTASRGLYELQVVDIIISGKKNKQRGKFRGEKKYGESQTAQVKVMGL